MRNFGPVGPLFVYGFASGALLALPCLAVCGGGRSGDIRVVGRRARHTGGLACGRADSAGPVVDGHLVSLVIAVRWHYW